MGRLKLNLAFLRGRNNFHIPEYPMHGSTKKPEIEYKITQEIGLFPIMPDGTGNTIKHVTTFEIRSFASPFRIAGTALLGDTSG